MDLTDDDLDAVAALIEAAADTDGVSPFNEEARLALRSANHVHWLARVDGQLAGYAQYDPAHRTAQLCVHPDARRRGLGASLLDAARDAGASGFWAFGDLPGARALAARAGLSRTRVLLIMGRALEGASAPTAPDGISLRGFEPGDVDAFLAINAAAFAGHPEQGAFSADDLAQRMAEPWWDPAGFIVAEDAEGLVGFHWTKRHDAETGEVYVIGVHPRAHGRGLGTVLLDAGLAHLAASGCTTVHLYVEHDNPAVRLYERAGFVVTRSDAQYTGGPHPVQ